MFDNPGYVAGRWVDLEGKPLAGYKVNFRYAVGRMIAGSTAVIDAEGLTITLGPDGQLSGKRVKKIGDWKVLELPASDNHTVQPVDWQIIVTELMPGGSTYPISVESQHAQDAPFIVSSATADLLDRPGAMVKPVISQNGTNIPAFAVPGRDLLLDNETGDLYAVVLA